MGGASSVDVISEETGVAGIFLGLRHPGVVWFPDSLETAATRFHQLPEERRRRVRLFYGEHIEFGLHAHLSRPVAYFTLLRQPVERVLSHYYFASEQRQPPEDVSLPDHISRYVEPNLQTRMMAGLPHRDGQMPEAEMLARAKDNLRACAVVGLTERFDETMLMLKKAFGWRMPFYERRHVNSRRPSGEAIPAEALRQIEADNQLDLALYAFAQELFAEQVRRYGPTLGRDVWVFRLMNRPWRLWRRTKVAFPHAVKTLAGRIFDRPYMALARWGGLRRLLPARLAPRVVATLENGGLNFDLKIDARVVGYYDPQRQRWMIRRPFHLLVDEQALPGMAGKNPA